MLAALTLKLEHYTPASKRRILLGAACLLLAACILVLIDAVNLLHARITAYDDQRMKTLWVTDQVKIIADHRVDRKAHADDGKTLVSVITSTAKKYEIVVSRYRPDGNGGIQLWITNTPVNAVWLWLDELLLTHSLRISKLSLSKSALSGHSDLQLDVSARQQPVTKR